LGTPEAAKRRVEKVRERRGKEEGKGTKKKEDKTCHDGLLRTRNA
jgi:hypothetical protein